MSTPIEKPPKAADFDDDYCDECGELIRVDGRCGTPDCDGPRSSSGEVKSYTARTVSLDAYRSEGVSVFCGRERGRLVAEAIRDDYGEGVAISVPEDTITICHSFRAGFHEVLPDVEIPSAV